MRVSSLSFSPSLFFIQPAVCVLVSFPSEQQAVLSLRLLQSSFVCARREREREREKGKEGSSTQRQEGDDDLKRL